jgi:hypothetical protein
LAAAGRQTARFTIVAVMIAMLGTLWVTPLAAGFGINLREVAKGASGVALITLVAAFLWNVVGTATARALRAELPAVDADEEALGAPRSRLGTLVPLISAVRSRWPSYPWRATRATTFHLKRLRRAWQRSAARSLEILR